MQKKSFFSSLFGVGLVLTITLTAIITTGKDGEFRLAPKSELEQFYEGTFRQHIDSIPANLAEKYQDTIVRLDAYIEENNVTGAIQSTAESFDLGYYYDIIIIGVVPYIEDPEFKQEVRSLMYEIDDLVTDKEELKKRNQEMFGDDPPKPTGECTPPPEEELVHI